MNIFQSEKAFIGNCSAEFLRKNSDEFWKLAKEIRSELGNKKYLFDSYLSMFFEAANNELAHDIASRGFDGFPELYNICNKVFDKKPFDERNKFYSKVKNFMYENPLQYQERQTKIYIYCLKLASDYTDYATKKIMERIDDNLRKVYEAMQLKEYYSHICDIVCEEKIENLNLLLKNIFVISPFIKTFFQGIQNQVLYCLISRDKETSKQIFQLILDS